MAARLQGREFVEEKVMPARTMCSGLIRTIAISAGLLAPCGAVHANPVLNFDITVTGGTAGFFNTSWNQNGSPTATPGVFSYTPGNSPFPTGINDPMFGEWSMAMWNINADNDPAGSGASTGARLGGALFTVTNNLPNAQDPAANHLQFSIIISMNVLTAQQPTSFFGNGGMTLNIDDSPFNNPGILTTTSGSMWKFLINGNQAAGLYESGYELGGSDGPTTASTSANLTPAQTGPLAGIVPTSIGIRLDFDLTPGETVSFNGLFGFVPGPGAAALLGLAALAGRTRRRR